MKRAALILFGILMVTGCGREFSSSLFDDTAPSQSVGGAGGSGGVATSSSSGGGNGIGGAGGGVVCECTMPHATSSCTDNTCMIVKCDQGYADCNNDPKDGCEALLSSDPKTCGDCKVTCAQFQTCKAGACVKDSCTAGTADCNNDPKDGCEVTLGTKSNCGFCADTCVLTNAISGCTNGTCTVASCLDGFADCDGDPKNGCETLVKVDANNCGKCGTVCGAWPNAAPACANGICGVLCSPNYANCNGAIGDGCEISLKSDPLNCGSCQKVCSTPHGSSGCTDGSCSVAGCDPNRADCNGVADDGCEVTLKTDPAHCGTCQYTCSVANGSPGCTNGNCSVASCDGGYDDCNDLVSDGCEVDLKTDPAHCGTCQNDCSVANGMPGCKNGSCSVASCDAIHGDCNGLVADGCEALTQTDMNNCGKCGNACGANTVCLSGFCNPLGLCGPIPQKDTWMCYKIPNHKSDVANGHVGFAGGKGSSVQDMFNHWANPFSGSLGACINPSAAEDTFLCSIGSLSPGTVVQLVPGIHPNATDGMGWYACDNGGSCIGSAELYVNGQTLGTMSNSVVTGLLSLVPSPLESNHYGLRFTTP